MSTELPSGKRTALVVATTKEERRILLHALGVDSRNRKPYRNYYVSGEGGDSYPLCMGLIDKGLMDRRRDLSGTSWTFFVTEAGRDEVMHDR